MKQLDIKIEGLSCEHCVNAVNNILKGIDGVQATKVSLPDNANVTFDNNKVTIDELKKAINDSEIYKTV